MTTCKSCGAAIFWQILPSGKRMPYNALPDYGVKDQDAKAPSYFTDEAGKHYITHFATCRFANQHRKERRYD